MGAFEVGLLAAAATVTQAAQVFCAKAGSLVASPTGKLAYQVGAQLASNLNKLAVAGMTAAKAEFAATQTAESAFVSSASSLPPIT